MKKKQWVILAGLIGSFWGLFGTVKAGEPETQIPEIIEAPETLVLETEVPEPESEPPVTEAPEPESEPPVTEAPEPESNPPVTEAPVTESVYLGIDNQHVYEGMEKSFASGYTPIVSGDSFIIVIPFTANGKLQDQKITVDLDFKESRDAPFQFLNYQKDVSRKTYTFQTKKGEEKQKAYLYRCKVYLQEDAAPGQYPVTVKASAYTSAGEKLTLDTRIYVQVPDSSEDVVVIEPEGDDSGGEGFLGGDGTIYGGEETEALIRQPKMLLEECNLSGKELLAGSRETMRAVFQNRSQSQTMYNLKVSLSTESTGLSFEKNSYYFSSVSPEGRIELEDQVDISKNTTESVIPITVTFEYEDEKGTPSTGEEKLEFRIRQPVAMELETSGIPAALYASDTAEVSVKALNLSRTGVYNVRVSLEGEGLFPTEEVFIGNMEAGTAKEGVLRMYVGTRTMKAIGEETGSEDSEKYGPVKGVWRMTYEDFLGNTYEVVKDYQTEIKKAQILSLQVEEEEEKTNTWWLSVLMVLLMSMLVMILLLIWRLRRKEILLEEAKKGGMDET